MDRMLRNALITMVLLLGAYSAVTGKAPIAIIWG